MTVLLGSLLLLAFLTALGWPLSRWWLRGAPAGTALLLAPHCGLALLGIGVLQAYLLNLPVRATAWPVAALAGACAIWGARHLRGLDWKPAAAAGLGLAAVLAFYGAPFLLNPDLVFFAQSGTDGNAYVQTALHQISHGVREAPAADPYHAYTGLLRSYIVPGAWLEKPATNMLLAYFSALAGRLPHEMFSPLMLVFVSLGYLGTAALGRRLGFGWGAAAAAGFLAAVSPSVAALSSNTYFSATATYGMFPALLVAARDAAANRRSAALFALLYTAYFLLSPPSWLIPLAAAGPYLAWRWAVEARRNRGRALAAAGVALGAFVGLNLMQLWLYAAAGGIVNRAFGGQMTPEQARWKWTLFFHTLGLAEITASPGTRLDLLGWMALAAVLAVAAWFLADSARRRDFSLLWFGCLSFWMMVLIGGVGGRFQLMEVLGRVSQQFGPLHPLVYVALARPVGARRLGNAPWRAVLGLALVLAIVHPFRPVWWFAEKALVTDPQRVNQHFRSTLAARREIALLAGDTPVALDSRTPTLVILANLASLFSNLKLAIPPEYLGKFRLDREPLPPNYRCAPWVLVPEYLADIQSAGGPGTVYRARGYLLRRNDLVLFFDNRTFPFRWEMDRERLRAAGLAPARTMESDTETVVCSQQRRTIRLRIRYTQLLRGDRVYEVQGGRVVFETRGSALVTPPLSLAPGLNTIYWKAAGGKGEPIEVLEMAVVEE